MLDTNPKRHYILDCILWHCNFICSILNQWLCAQYSSGVRGLFWGANMLIKAGLDSITSDSWWQSDVHDGSNDGSLGSCLWSQVMRADQWSWGEGKSLRPRDEQSVVDNNQNLPHSDRQTSDVYRWLLCDITVIPQFQVATAIVFPKHPWCCESTEKCLYLLFKRFMQIYLQQW